MTDNCGKKKPFERKTLADAVPDIDKYWDKEKNDGKSPSDFSRTSSEKVWTKCPICGTSVKRNVRYTWEADENGVGHVIHCRTCGKRNKENSLVLIVPEIKKYWVYEKNEHGPEYYTISSGKRVYVKCPHCEKERYIAVADATRQNKNNRYYVTACDDCAKRDKVLSRRLRTNILEKCPDVYDYWDEKNIFTPLELTVSDIEKIYTHCPTCGDLMERQALHSFIKGDDGYWHVKRCAKCILKEANGKKAMALRGPVIDECPEIGEWWDDELNELGPDEVTRGSHYEAFFRCPACQAVKQRSVHKFLAVHRDGSLRPVACPECGYSSAKGDPEDNLVKVCPEIEDWWDYEKNAPFRPEQFSKGSCFRAYLICPDCGLELYSGIHALLHTTEDGTVVISHNGRCRKYRAMESENNLVAQYPEVEDWWDYKKNYPHRPEEYTLFSPHKMHFKCPNCGQESYKRITDAFNTNDLGYPRLFKCAYCEGIKPIRGKNSLAALYPEIAAQCISTDDTERIFPSASSRMKWKCEKCGGTWFDLVVNRVNGQGCPYCEGRAALPGFNSLKDVKPGLLPEWSENNERLPDEILPTSSYRALWKCPTCGHEYEAAVNYREVGDDACPYCSGRKALPGFNSLKDVKPELLPEWSENNERLPDEILPTSSYRALWKCPTCGHEYEAAVNYREVGDDACPYCTGRKILPGYNSLKAVKPELSLEWSNKNEQSADEILPTSWMRALWECPTCGGEYEAAVKDREVGDNACPYCAGRKALPGYNSLKAVKPELSLEWSNKNEQSVDEILPTSWMRALWECSTCGGEYEAAVKDREVGDNACPYCAGRKALSGYNSLKDVKPELLPEWSENNERLPDEFLPTSYFRALWKCPTCGHEYEAAVKDREVGDDACPYCSGRKSLPGFNSLKDVKPELLSEWSENNERLPDEFLPTSYFRALWKCPTCGGEYEAAIKVREVGDDACPYCAGKKVLPGFNSLKVKNPDLLEEWADVENMFLGIDPDQIFATYDENVWWECQTCGQKYMMSVKDRLMKQKRGHEACPNCKGRRWKKTYVV